MKRPGPLVGSAKLNPGVAQPLLVGIDRSYPSAMLICWRAALERVTLPVRSCNMNLVPPSETSVCTSGHDAISLLKVASVT